jgi:hypothetical protein
MFALGQVVMTIGVQNWLENSPTSTGHFRTIMECLNKHSMGDWGESLDADANNSALKNGDDRMVSVWHVGGDKFWIYTEHDRSVTTILFPNEY